MSNGELDEVYVSDTRIQGYCRRLLPGVNAESAFDLDKCASIRSCGSGTLEKQLLAAGSVETC